MVTPNFTYTFLTENVNGQIKILLHTDLENNENRLNVCCLWLGWAEG